MMKFLAVSTISLLALTACAPYAPENVHAGYCNEINSQIIFNGNTSYTRKSEIEMAEAPMLQRSYDKSCS